MIQVGERYRDIDSDLVEVVIPIFGMTQEDDAEWVDVRVIECVCKGEHDHTNVVYRTAVSSLHECAPPTPVPTFNSIEAAEEWLSSHGH